jgi:transposase
MANLSSPGLSADTPTRSDGANESGAKERSAVRNVALDLGAKKICYCEVACGQVVQRATVSAIETLSTLVGPEQPMATIAIEACREAWYVHDLLTSWGNRVVLVDTTRSKQLGIGQHGRKNDRIDAEVLARAVERGGIPLAHVLSPQRRELRRQLGVRRALVESRAQLVTTIRGLAREQGQKLPSCMTPHFARNVRKTRLADPLQLLLEPLLATLECLEVQLGKIEQELSRLCRSEPMIVRLCTTPGVGPIVAACFVAVIDDAKRFRHAHQVESYLGLVPSEESTGGRRRIGAITKKGNSYLRALLVQAAHTILRSSHKDDPLYQWGQAVVERRGKRIGVVAVARRLVGILWAIWRDGATYDPDVLQRRGSRGLRSNAQKIQSQAEALERVSRKPSCRLLTREVTLSS